MQPPPPAVLDFAATDTTRLAVERRRHSSARALRAAAIAGALLAVGCSSGEGGSTCVPSTSATTKTLALPGATGGGTTSITAVTGFGTNPGGLSMYVHVPASLPANAPVVFALHGCTQSASAYVAAGWNELADSAGFLVVYPEQTSSNNIQQCFRWWDPAHTTRGQGEAQSIRDMLDYVRAKYDVGDAYITGLSAGGAMTAVMLATYPDVFHAGAVMSGLAYHCATSQIDAYSCMSGKDMTAAALTQLLSPQAHSTPPRVSVWQGDADYTVRPANATQIVRQFATVNGVAETASTNETVGKATHDTYRDSKGAVRIESWIIGGMGHGTSLDPANGCGSAGAYLLDEKLCSTRKAAEFFGIVAATSTGSTGASGSTGSSGTAGSNGGTGTSSSGATSGSAFGPFGPNTNCSE